MSRFWSETVRSLEPYTPGEQPQHARLIKLNTNESPYPPSPRVLDAIARVSGDDLRRYPDPEATDLRRVIADHYALQPGQVFLGNGSDEVLAHVFLALLKTEQPLLFPDISYSFYPVWCALHGIAYRQIPLDDDFQIDVAAYTGAGGVILPNPNAPTGIALPQTQLRILLKANRDAVVVVDEAYADFAEESAVSLIEEFDNLLVVQTLSKSRALAGLRVGLALGHEALIEGLSRVKNSFNSYPLDIVAQRAAKAAFEDPAYFSACRDKIIASRERLATDLRAQGFTVLPSAANFLLARPPAANAARLFQQLRERGIVVRYFDKPRIREYLRITVGTDDECSALLEALEKLA